MHWLSPLKRGDKRITNNDMLHFTGMFTDKDHDVLYKKIKDGGSWLYSFYDRKKGAQEEKDWFEYHRDKPFDTEETALQSAATAFSAPVKRERDFSKSRQSSLICR